MSMSANPQDFEALRRLIALKRYERPHPRFFNDFSSAVIARIQAGEQARSGLLSLMLSWIWRAGTAFETSRMWAGFAGLGACALVVAGFVISETAGSASPDIPAAPGGTVALMGEHPVVANPM